MARSIRQVEAMVRNKLAMAEVDSIELAEVGIRLAVVGIQLAMVGITQLAEVMVGSIQQVMALVNNKQVDN